MIFTPASLQDAYIIDIEKREDARGFFGRAWCVDEFTQHGLDAQLAQASISFNHKRGTLRGMHWQAEPHGEVKVVRCTSGAIYDVIVDVRPESPSYLKWIGVELSAANRRALYIPKGFAHGFQTLADDTEVFYFISAFYAPEAARGARYNEPAFGITWPLPISIIAAKDEAWPDYQA